MNRNRWLMALLLVSWTLNVALAVVLYLKSTHPPGGSWRLGREEAPIARITPPLPPGPPGVDFRREIAPLLESRERLGIELAAAFDAGELDTSRIFLISDSLNIIKGRMQRQFIGHLCRMHGELPPEARHRMAQRMMSRLECGPGPDPGHQHQQRMGRPQRFKYFKTE